MSWWMWVLLGVVLLAVEIVTPGGLFALFFGLSAVLVGGLAALGVEAPWVQWLLFPALGVALLAILRRRLHDRLGRGPQVGSLVGELAVPRGDLEPGATGSADLRGAPWTAVNEGPGRLARGQRCRVTRVQDLTLFIRPE